MHTRIPPHSFAAALLLGCVSLAAPAIAQELADGPGKETFVRVCSACHSTETIQNRHQDKAAWTDTVFKMVDFGAETTKDEREAIITYLAAQFGPMRTGRPAPGAPPPVESPSDTSSAPATSTDPDAAKAKTINLNAATAKDLETNLALTARDAEAIVQYRKDHGAFKQWRDVLNVEGVDAKKIEEAKDRLTIEAVPLPRQP